MYRMEPYINVEPRDLIQVITKIKIKVLSLELNQFATIQVTCYDDLNNFLHSYVFELREEYQFWINDEWIINYVMNRYGFIIKNNINVQQ